MKEITKAIQIQYSSELQYGKGSILSNKHGEKNNPNNESLDIDHMLPEPPKDEPQPKDENEINCSELFKLLDSNKKDKVLIIDLRKEEEYAKLTISFEDNVVHFDEDIIKPE